LEGPGENAGVIDIGDGWAVAFKMESHNHPSAVDPHNGAATGVGGIIRDILSMGARPIALVDSLRFGPLTDPKSRRIARGVVAGIAAYGNCVGVPTVAGEIFCDLGYRDNPLVNVACLGLLRHDHIAHSRAAGPGNPVMYAGARTGRDGIGGAAFASQELHEESEHDDRASVQIGDPLAGKLLIEATLEALRTGDVVALQDMGAAGLTCATSEMSARGGVGMIINLDQVPLREASMRVDEIFKSESQERMLLVVRQGSEDRISAVFRRWGLQAAVIGQVTADRELRAEYQESAMVSLPPYALAEAPAYRPAACEPPGLTEQWIMPDALPPVDPGSVLTALLGSSDVASKHPVFEQYDHMVQIRTVVPPGAAGASVLRIHESPPKAVAITVDGNGRLCALDPYRGARLAIAEAAANLACVGAEPLGVTDCLNFGSPDDPEVFWMFRQAVMGITDACRALQIPVVGGNVSFYNESPEGPVPPTPVVAMVGLIRDVAQIATQSFKTEDDVVVLLGNRSPGLAASYFLMHIHGLSRGRPADVDLSNHARVLAAVRQAIRDGLLKSAYDCSDGGIAVALAECAIAGSLGANVTLSSDNGADVALFGEAPSRVVVSLPLDRLPDLQILAANHGVELAVLGSTGGSRLRIDIMDRRVVDLALDELIHAHAALDEVFG
ncbi:MAG TPA: phosphoribosylformylglycinamidine synthase subunit PurL, partial [bacterium]|nr:phosphoribosylformylglycinamidine synthase subunit PurL [bacterium]